ncbi:MAG: hypothetical protein MR051_00445 [Lentisphaeria bacterium]|nr:hypothetical protein [Lentisphaeria bacterium]
MREKKAGGSDFPRLFALFAARMNLFAFLSAGMAAFCSALQYFFRPLWFDEALTLNFAYLPDPAAIYRAYVIPNNQILHTVALHYLHLRAEIPVLWLRFFPLICAVLLLVLLVRGFGRECGHPSLPTVLGALAFSPPFLLYATALRGYMLAALLVTSAWLCGRKFAVSGKFTALAGWCGFAAAALGVMPSALAGLAGAGLMILPLFGKYFWKKRRFYLLAAAVPAAFALFYGPILPQLQRAFALKEGWHDPGAALLALGIALAATFNVLFIAAAVPAGKLRFRTFCYAAVWLLPLGGSLLPVAPFPRVWFVLFPIWAVLLAKGVRHCRSLRWWWGVPVLIAAICGTLRVREALSPYCARSGQDDFFAPYFLRQEFVPYRTAAKLRELRPPMIYASLSADPWSLLAFGTEVVFDGPRSRVAALHDGAAVVLGRDENPADMEKRFGGRLIPVAPMGYQTVYQWRSE